MIGKLLTRGLLAGLCAGLLAWGFAEVAAEPQINRAIAFENQRIERASHGQEHGDKGPVSRSVQSTAGLLLATGLYGVAFGGLFALAFAAAQGRVLRRRPAHSSPVLAASAFGTVILVPFLKYPANPPSVGSAATIGSRTELYLAMIAISVAAAVAALRVARRYGAAAGTAGYVLLVTGAALALPSVNELPPGFPAAVLWNFRIASLGTQLVLWTTIGVGFGLLAERLLNPRAQGASVPSSTVSASE